LIIKDAATAGLNTTLANVQLPAERKAICESIEAHWAATATKNNEDDPELTSNSGQSLGCTRPLSGGTFPDLSRPSAAKAKAAPESREPDSEPDSDPDSDGEEMALDAVAAIIDQRETNGIQEYQGASISSCRPSLLFMSF
jgi:hypothetical protein